MQNAPKQAVAVRWEVWRRLTTWNKISSHRSEAAALESAAHESAHGTPKNLLEIRYIETYKYSNYSEEK